MELYAACHKEIEFFGLCGYLKSSKWFHWEEGKNLFCSLVFGIRCKLCKTIAIFIQKS